ncbi:S1 family peptidase [Arthrobacter sp. GMC3]|uniref:S1 family peptidase n=1 Tax=Arthrobacter sp. GMC3 TaxID=2058894 RepID=UPI000CE4E3D0|nr:S1 family peptidase [Arthrobacter sp. GMC3]
MQASTRAHFRRTGAACAAAAVLIGGTFTGGAASAAPFPEPTPTSTATQLASSPATEASSLPGGLGEALQRDLGMSVEEFNAQGALAEKAAAIQSKVVAADPGAVVSLSGDTIKVQTTTPDVAKSAAGDAKLAIAAPATSSPSKVDATGVDALFNDYVATFGAKNLLSVSVNTKGEYVIRTGEPTPETFAGSLGSSVADFAAKYGNVVLEEANGPAKATYAPGDPFALVNGQGFVALNPATSGGVICSTGWNGFNKAGAPAIISAGHCSLDGAAVPALLTNPLSDEAVTGDPKIQAQPMALLGMMGFSQFGGPNNTRTTANPDNIHAEGNIGTDVSVIDSIGANFSQAPKVAKWTGAAGWTAPEQISTDPGNVAVTGVAPAVLDAPVCKSGRTTGWTCAKVDELGAYVIAGINYPSAENPGGDPADLRAVRGFMSITDTVMSDHGDSGGPVISGNAAVGIVSGGGKLNDGKNFAITADLQTALAATNGYTVKIFLNNPAVTPGTVYRRGAINGTVADAPAGTIVTVTIDGAPKDVAVGSDGTWSIQAPNTFGTFPITAQAKNGFSTSGIMKASIEVIKETAPAFTAPALNGTSAAPVTAITGTGIAGATVSLTGDVSGTAVVGGDGTWSVAVTPGLGVGNYTVIATQTRADWTDSPSATNSFKVVPAAPAVTSPTNGQQFGASQGPTVISGTNIAGAAVTVTVDGQQHRATVTGTTWSFTFSQKFGAGNHSISAVQNVDGVDSLIAASNFTVLAAPVPAGTTEPTPTTVPVVINNLAATGASSSMFVVGGAGGLLLLGGGATLLFRRRKDGKDRS